MAWSLCNTLGDPTDAAPRSNIPTFFSTMSWIACTVAFVRVAKNRHALKSGVHLSLKSLGHSISRGRYASNMATSTHPHTLTAKLNSHARTRIVEYFQKLGRVSRYKTLKVSNPITSSHPISFSVLSQITFTTSYQLRVFSASGHDTNPMCTAHHRHHGAFTTLFCAAPAVHLHYVSY